MSVTGVGRPDRATTHALHGTERSGKGLPDADPRERRRTVDLLTDGGRPRDLLLEASPQEEADPSSAGTASGRFPGTSMTTAKPRSVCCDAGSPNTASRRRRCGPSNCVVHFQPPRRRDPGHPGVRGRGLRLAGTLHSDAERLVTAIIDPSSNTTPTRGQTHTGRTAPHLPGAARRLHAASSVHHRVRRPAGRVPSGVTKPRPGMRLSGSVTAVRPRATRRPSGAPAHNKPRPV